ncbi:MULTISPECIES: glycosyltransferase family 4 protein [unclassified Nocardioides]|uniref:glycosyltransferase family 4 protein n=1 Tax=unclassified Nocardioides TaxID=2615069 RepID=UPI003620BF7D
MNRSVLHVAHHVLPHVGGLEAVVAAETRGLRARGWDVRVVSSAAGATPGTHVEGGVTTVRVRAWNVLEERYGAPFPLFSPRLLTVLGREVRRADLVHVHDALYLSSWVAALWCVLTRTPYVVHRHVGFVHHSSALVRLVQRVVLGTAGRLVLARAAAVLAIDEPIATGLRSGGVDRVHVLANGVDTARFHPVDDEERRRTRSAYALPDGPLALFVGRFVPKKGFGVVAKAASDDHAIAFVGGDRPDGVTDPRLHFLGSLPPERMPEVYACADVMVVASVGECPLTVLEALSSGLFLLANDDPALHSPWTAGPGVEHVDMAGGRLPEALRKAFVDLDALREAGVAGRAHVAAAYSWDAHLDRLEKLYRAQVERVSISP